MSLMFVCPRCGERSANAGSCTRDGEDLAATDDPLLGTVVGRYRLSRFLGRGGMGRVYAAVQPELGSHVAIKVLSDDAADRADLVERFFAEARTASLIHHEGIISVLDLLRTSDGRPAIVMELVDGKTLRELTRGGSAPLGGIAHVMLEVLSAIAAAHASGIIHRDLKPDNILVTPSGHAKVLDFGIAKLAAQLPGAAPRTRTGAILGTPQYMSPEQIDGGTVDARSDIYSAGIVLFEAITGHRPFEGATDFALMRAHIETPPPSPRERRPDLPPALEHVVLRALAKRRGDRFESANAMAHALHAATAALTARDWRALVPGVRMLPLAVPPTPVPQVSLVTAPLPGPAAPSTREDRGPTTAGSGSANRRGRDSTLARDATLRDSREPPGSDPREPPIAEPREPIASEPRQPSASRLRAPIEPEPRQPSAAEPSGLRAPSASEPSPPSIAKPSPPSAAEPSPPSAAEPSAAEPSPPSSRRRWSRLVVPFAAALVGGGVVAAIMLPRSPRATPSPTPAGDRGTPESSSAPIEDTGTSPRPPIAVSAAPVASPPGGLAPVDTGLANAPPRDAGAGMAPAIKKPAHPSAPPIVVTGPSVTTTADYDPKHFDPIAYLRRAQTLARSLIADAAPIGFEFTPVFRDGHVDLTAGAGNNEMYTFRTRRPPASADADGLKPCFVIVKVTAKQVEATRHRAPECGVALPAYPQCTPAQYFAKVAPISESRVRAMHVTWASTQYAGHWESDNVDSDAGFGFHSDDDCGGPAAKPRQRDPVDQPAQATADEPTRTTVVKHAYDPGTFEPVAYLATAQKLAHQLVEDAALTEMFARKVSSDGRMLWSFTPIRIHYRFRSPSRSLIEPTRDNQGQHPCHVIVELEETGKLREASARRDDEGHCDEPIEPVPRCSVPQIWARARAAGVEDNQTVEVTWIRSRWRVTVNGRLSADRTVPLNDSGSPITFDDDCK